MQMLRCRQALCVEVNRIFGTDISVDFSPVWKVELAGFINRDTDGDGMNDIMEGSDSDVDSDGTSETTNETGNESGTAGTDSEPAETETEPAETETELTEIIDGGEDIPAMNLAEPDETKTEPNETVTISEVAELFGVDETEILMMLGRGDD